MQTQNRLFDDLARLASGAMGVANEMRREVEGRVRRQVERMLDQMDLVTREEFEVVKAMAAKAREEQEVLAERLAALEARFGSAAPSGAAKTKAKPKAARPAAKRAAKTKPKPATSGPNADGTAGG